jgi:hypothetical protein
MNKVIIPPIPRLVATWYVGIDRQSLIIPESIVSLVMLAKLMCDKKATR